MKTTFKPARLLMLLFTTIALPVMAQTLVVVNGKAIPSARAEVMIKQLTSQGQPDTPQLRSTVKEELVNREILVQEADKQGLSRNADVRNQVELARQSIIIRALFNDYLKKHPVTDAEIKAEYDKLKAQAGDKEYHVRHILVDKEEDAKAIITKLKAGDKFEELAKQSKDTGTAINGGDLSWATPASFAKPFADAVVAMKKGHTTDTPVKTEFGYHVIKLEDIRPVKVPTLEEVKPRIADALQQKKLQTHQEELRKRAKVQ